jgi:hypothetical protein
VAAVPVPAPLLQDTEQIAQGIVKAPHRPAVAFLGGLAHQPDHLVNGLNKAVLEARIHSPGVGGADRDGGQRGDRKHRRRPGGPAQDCRQCHDNLLCSREAF